MTFAGPVIDNNRYGSLEFDVPIDTILHGFAGYFDCILYKDVTLSKCSLLFVVSSGKKELPIDLLVPLFVSMPCTLHLSHYRHCSRHTLPRHVQLVSIVLPS